MTTERHSDGTNTHLTITDAGQVVAQADLTRKDADTVEASLWAQAGPVPAGTRATLVDAVLDAVREQPATHLRAAVPSGDAESLIRLRERCDTMETRPAGATVLVEAAPPRE